MSEYLRESGEENPSLKGKYSDLYLGERVELSGHVDAPHAQEMTPAQFAKVIHTGSFYSARKKMRVEPKKSCLYLNDDLRSVLSGSVKGETAQIGDQIFTLKEARKLNPEDEKYQDLIVHPDDKEAVCALLATKVGGAHDGFTDLIAGRYHQLGGDVVIGTINRGLADLNRGSDDDGALFKKAQWEAVREYRDFKRKILERKNLRGAREEVTQPYLHIAVHGKRDTELVNPKDADIELGTLCDRACDKDIRDWFRERLIFYLERPPGGGESVKIKDRPVLVQINVRFTGDRSRDMGRQVHGRNYHTIQVEFCRYLRLNYGEILGEILYRIMEEFTATQVSPIDQGLLREVRDNLTVVIDGGEVKDEDLEPFYTLKVMPAKKEDWGKSIIGLPFWLAGKLGVTTGDQVVVRTRGEGTELVMIVKVYDLLEKDQVLLDEGAREVLRVDPQAAIQFEIEKK